MQWGARTESSPPVESKEPKLTLRDQFAMAALTGILSGTVGRLPQHDAASWAYTFAEAMMEEKKNRG